MKKKMIRRCHNCPDKILNKDTVALNLKLLGRDLTDFYCLDCMAESLEVTVQDLLGLDSAARMNVPSVPEGNWTWRLTTIPDTATAAWLRENTYLYRRGR